MANPNPNPNASPSPSPSPNPNPHQAERRFGARGLGLLVNNVGTNLRKPSTEYTDAEYEMLHATNQASPSEP